MYRRKECLPSRVQPLHRIGARAGGTGFLTRGGLVLGREAFVEKVHKVIETSDRLFLAEIFGGRQRNEGIHDAVCRWGYTLKDVDNHVGLHYSQASGVASMMTKRKPDHILFESSNPIFHLHRK